jgi:hypothetical protein
MDLKVDVRMWCVNTRRVESAGEKSARNAAEKAQHCAKESVHWCLTSADGRTFLVVSVVRYNS